VFDLTGAIPKFLHRLIPNAISDMSKIHIATTDGKQTAYSENEFQSLRMQGCIPDDALYWKPGMAEWQPFSKYEDSAAMASASTSHSSSSRRLKKDPRGITTFLVVMLWLFFGMEIISIVSDSLEIGLLQQAEITDDQAAMNDMRQGLVAIVYLVVFLITGITFLVWQYRACKVSRSLGAHGLKYSPGWAVAYYFIPILCVFRPYQVMRETWQVSLNPRDWDFQPGTPLLGWWWALWLLSGFVSNLGGLGGDSVSEVQAFIFADYCAIASSAIGLPLCIVLITLIRKITAQQMQHIR